MSAYICHEASFNYDDTFENDLRRWLDHRGLSTEGDKAELVARLRADDRNPARTCKCDVCPKYREVACDSECTAPLPFKIGRPARWTDEEDAATRPLEGLSGRDRLVEFAALRCAAVDDVEWEALLPHRKDRYRDLARAVFMTLPHHIGGQLWDYVETKAPWSPSQPPTSEASPHE